jgi:GntR family transcriptional repressor for pyruvate dehydrogenase complex
VRDALRVLEQMGLIESRHGDGTYVRTLEADELTEPMATLLLQSREQMKALWEVRRVLEPAFAECAAKRVTAEELEEMAAVLEEQQRKVDRGLTAVEEDAAFHYAIAQATQNPVMVRLTDTLVDLLRASRERSLQQGDRPKQSLAGHRRILEALRRRDPDQARAAMLRHVAEVEERIFPPDKS